MQDHRTIEVFPLPRARASRRRLVFVLFGLVLVGAVASWYGYLFFASESRLQAAYAEADRLDPGWRLEDMQARRAAVRDEENSALLTMAVKQAMPWMWPSWEYAAAGQVNDLAERQRQALQESFDQLPPAVQLNEEQEKALRGEMGRAAAAVAEARKMATLPRGRHPITFSPDWIGTNLPTVQDTRQSASLLRYDAWLRAHERDLDGALLSVRATLNAERSLIDEPFLIALLVRYACQAVALRALERALAQGEASEPALAALQQLVEQEEADPGFLVALRGERVGSDQFMQFLQGSKFSMHQYAGLLRPGSSTSPWDMVQLQFPGSLKANRAALFRYQTQLVEIAKLPPEQQEAPTKALEATLPKQPILVRMLAPAVSKVGNAYYRSLAQLRCVAVMLAAERYRLEHGSWPENIETLVPRYLARVPLDTYDGKPLRFRRVEEGLVIYSVGHDHTDDGGKLSKNPMEKGTDWGYRLWDVSKRRQAPEPIKIPPAADAIEKIP